VAARAQVNSFVLARRERLDLVSGAKLARYRAMNLWSCKSVLRTGCSMA